MRINLFKRHWHAGLGAMLALAMSSSLAATSNTATFTLSSLAQMALDSHPSLVVAQAETEQARAAQSAAHALSRPTVKLQSELSYAWMQKKDFPRTANQLVATYPLYEPGVDDQQSIRNWQLQAKQSQLTADQQALLRRLANTYFELMTLEAQHQFLQKETQAIRESLAQVEQRFQVGYRDLNDVVEIQAKLDNNQALLLDTQQKQWQKLADLQALVGEQVVMQQLPMLSDALADHAINLPTEAEWLNWINAHPAMQSLTFMWQANQAQQMQTKHQDGLKIEAFGAYVYNDSQKNFYDDMQGARGGVQLSLPLYLGGKTDANIAQVRAQSQEVLAQKQALALNLTAQARKSQIGVNSGLARLKVLKSALVSNQQALRSAEEGLKTGSRNILDVLAAQSRLFRAQQAIPTTQAQIQRDKIDFYWAVGRLSIDQLQK